MFFGPLKKRSLKRDLRLRLICSEIDEFTFLLYTPFSSKNFLIELRDSKIIFFDIILLVYIEFVLQFMF